MYQVLENLKDNNMIITLREYCSELLNYNRQSRLLLNESLTREDFVRRIKLKNENRKLLAFLENYIYSTQSQESWLIDSSLSGVMYLQALYISGALHKRSWPADKLVSFFAQSGSISIHSPLIFTLVQ